MSNVMDSAGLPLFTYDQNQALYDTVVSGTQQAIAITLIIRAFADHITRPLVTKDEETGIAGAKKIIDKDLADQLTAIFAEQVIKTQIS